MGQGVKHGQRRISQARLDTTHVQEPSVHGILFASTQNEDGINLVLFADSEQLLSVSEQSFHVQYVEDSLKFYASTAVRYDHAELSFFVDKDGVAHTYSTHDHEDDWDDSE